MKTLNFYKLIILFFAVTMISSCVKDDDYDTPTIVVTEPVLDSPVISVDNIASAWEQEQEVDQALVNLTFETKQYLEGYVVSNDEFGNFFEEIIIQDNLENPTTGIRILIDENPLFTRFEIGRKIYVNLKDLSVGISNGVLSLGIGGGTFLEAVPAPRLDGDFIIRSTEVGTLVPLELDMNNLPSLTDDEDGFRLTNRLIKLNNVQFNRNDVLGDNPITYAGEENDEFDGERTLESCDSGSTITFSTSTFADFKSISLPAGRGSITGILTKNFFGDTFNFVINNINDVNLDNEDRCDPTEVTCGLANDTGSNVLFSDFFESFNDGETISGNGWTNYIEAGSRDWETFFSDSSNGSLGISATIGSFLSGDTSSIAWLITPEFNFDDQDNETLNFKTSNSFSDGSNLELLFSSDWDGNQDNIASATWDLLSDAYIVQDNDSFSNWFDSGNVDLSCITGSGHIALKYTGSGDEGFDGTYEFDEIEINY